MDQRSLRTAMSPIANCPHPRFPSGVVPLAAPTDLTVAEQMTFLRDSAPENSLYGLEIDHGHDEILQAWRHPLSKPREWVEAYTCTSLETWKFWSPLWQAALPLWTRELNRVGVACVRGAEVELLNSLHPEVACRNGQLVLANGRRIPLAGRDLILVPMVSGPSHYLIQEDGTQLTLAYPLPGHTRLWMRETSPPGPHGDAADLVLGKARADLLRALVTPCTAGQLARELHYSPSTITHHCDHLEQSGLIERRRAGQSMVVRRSLRGDEVLELLSGAE